MSGRVLMVLHQILQWPTCSRATWLLVVAATVLTIRAWQRGELAPLGALAVSDPTGRGDYHGDVEKVRENNTEDPHRKIHDGPPAVTRAAR